MLPDGTPYAEGPLTARIAFVGEAAGENEESQQRPFVGKAGNLLTQMLSTQGISRSDSYFDNVLQLHPPNNDITPHFRKSGKNFLTSETFLRHAEELKARLRKTSANVLVAVGNTALWVLTGKYGVIKYRGSILTWEGRKVIPIIHPSACLHHYDKGKSVQGEWSYRYFILHDLERIRKNSFYPETRLPQRSMILSPSIEELVAFIRSAREGKVVAVDIETIGGRCITHISIAVSPTVGICIPLFENGEDIFDSEDEIRIWLELASLLADKNVLKLGHNMVFDAYHLFTHTGAVTSPTEDTMIAQAIVYPDFPKSLAFVTSICCKGEPFYKDTGKNIDKPIYDVMEFRWYNTMDSLVLFEIWEQLQFDLAATKNTEAYKRQKALIYPLMFMEYYGQALNIEAMRDTEVMDEEVEQKTKELLELVGHPLNINSPKQVSEYLYDEKGYSRLKGVDVTSLKRLINKGCKEAKLILDIRHLTKLKGTYFDMGVDEDERFRCSYNPVGTTQGRISSSKTTWGTGMNAQNQPPEMLDVLVADDEYIQVQIDLEQAENRVTAYEAGEMKMIEAFESGADIHKLTASLILGKPPELITDIKGDSGIGSLSERDLGKRANHGLNYGLGYKTFALKWEIPETASKMIVEAYHASYSKLREWHSTLRDELSRQSYLENCFGRRYYFKQQWGNEMFLQAYSFKPQSTVGDILNYKGMHFVYDSEEMILRELALLRQVHDSIYFQYPLDKISDLISSVLLICDSLETPLTIRGRKFSIPCGIKFGFTAKGDLKISSTKLRANRESFEQELKAYIKEKNETIS